MTTTPNPPEELDMKAAVKEWGISDSKLRRFIKGSYRKPGTTVRKECKVTEMRPGYHYRQDGPGKSAKIFLHRERCEQFLRERGYLNTAADEPVQPPKMKLVQEPSRAWSVDAKGQDYERLTFHFKPSNYPITGDDHEGYDFEVKTKIKGVIWRFSLIFDEWTERERIIWKIIGDNNVSIFCKADHEPEEDLDGSYLATCWVLPFEVQYSKLRSYLERDYVQLETDRELKLRAAALVAEKNAEPTEEAIQLETFNTIDSANASKPSPISGHQGRVNRGATQLAIECPNKKVRDRIGDCYRLYGEPLGISQSAFLIDRLLEALTSYDSRNGGAWMKAAADGPDQS